MILWLTNTHGRYRCLQRNLRCFLDQDFKGDSVMYVCNTGTPLKLPEDFVLPENKKVYIDNSSMMNFLTLGQKYIHALKMAKFLYPDITVITHADDDDIFLPNHLSQGSLGINMAYSRKQLAYKPYFSYFRERDPEGNVLIRKLHNNFEPSIFINVSHVLEHLYSKASIKHHLKWLNPLLEDNQIFVNPDGVSTLIYNWGDDWQTYKLSGKQQDTLGNYQMGQVLSKDMGKGILIPSEDNSYYYKQIENIK